MDVRVEVKIPGGVEYYLVDLKGEKHQIRDEIASNIWSETFVSAVLRSILDDNHEPDGNDGKPLLGLRKLDPLHTPEAESRFLEMAADEFWKGLILCPSNGSKDGNWVLIQKFKLPHVLAIIL